MTQRDTENGTVTGTALTVLPGTARVRPSLARSANNADFLSQLIAERHHLAPQRERRRAALTDALKSYRTGADIARRRVPPGYRTTIVV